MAPFRDVTRELRGAWRSLRAAPAFSLAAVSSLALGLTLVGATLAVVNAYLIRTMPHPAAERLHHVVYDGEGEPEPEGVASLDWRSLADVVDATDHSAPARLLVEEEVGRRELMALRVGADAPEMLGLGAALGRSLVADDFREGAESIALLSHALWHSRYGGDPGVIGRTLLAQPTASGEPPESFRIVGVLPADFRYARDHSRAIELVTQLRFQWPAYLVRLREGVTPAYAEARISEAVRLASPTVSPEWRGVRLESIHERYTAQLRSVLIAISFAAAMVLGIVCLNLGVLMLLRALRRQKDVAVRVALGARGAHIARMLAAESALICAASLIFALLLTRTALGVLAPLIETRLGRGAPAGTETIAVDVTVLALLGAAGILIALVLSLLPLRVTWSRRLTDLLRSVARGGTDSRAMRRVRASLVSLEVAASLALLVGCGLMIRTVVTYVRTDFGFEMEDVVRARIALPERGYPDEASFMAFYDALTGRLETQGVPFALTSFIPLFEYRAQPVEAEARGPSGVSATVQSMSDGYLELMGIPLREGRGFSAADRSGSEPVALVSESLARRLWPEGRALGSRILVSDQTDPRAGLVARSVVGVVADVRQTYRDQTLEDVYLPFPQSPTRYAPIYFRTELPTAEWLDALRVTAASLDPAVLVSGDVTGGSALAAEADRLLGAPRFLAGLLATFAAFTALLALLGIYGVTAYSARQREREIAVRVAVGATHPALIRLFLGEGALVIGVGILAGLGGGAVVARLLESQIHGVAPFDLPTFLGMAALTLAGGLMAVWLPARRVAAETPMARLNES